MHSPASALAPYSADTLLERQCDGVFPARSAEPLDGYCSSEFVLDHPDVRHGEADCFSKCSIHHPPTVILDSGHSSHCQIDWWNRVAVMGGGNVWRQKVFFRVSGRHRLLRPERP